MQYLYVKNGDAAEQVERIARAGFAVSPHGPDAFVSDFLAATANCRIHVLSRGLRKARLQQGDITAETRNGGGRALGKFWHRSVFALLLGYRILRLRPDRILCGSTGSQLLICSLAGRVLGIPVVHSRHNSLREKTRNPVNNLRRAVDAMLLRGVFAVVVHGPYLRAQVLQAGARDDRVFEFEVSFPEPPPAPSHSERQAVLYVGRIEIEKGIIDLLHAALPLLQADSSRSLVFVGRGSALDLLTAEADRYDVQPQIEVKGPVPHDQVLSIMQAAFLVVTPTRTVFPEGRCMVVLESLVSGVPVIAPNHGPFPYAIVHEENGLLFESDNVASLGDALQRVFTDAELARRLRQGAARSSRQLRESDARFSSAVFSAFSIGQ